jgi:hypothetical protein
MKYDFAYIIEPIPQPTHLIPEDGTTCFSETLVSAYKTIGCHNP